MNAPQTDDRRFDENVPFYVNGSLEAMERSWMDSHLAAHPHKRHDIQQAHQERLHSQRLRSEIPESERLARLYRELRWNQAPVNPKPDIPPPVRDVLVGPWISAVAGVVLGGLLVAGLGLLPQQGSSTNPGLELYRGGQIDCTPKPGIRIALAPQVQWVHVVQMLRTLQLQLINGPNQDGEIWVRETSGTSTTEALALLRNSPWVEQAIPADADRALGSCPK
jgi:hypothetical protein